jgi:hypothetical protein
MYLLIVIMITQSPIPYKGTKVFPTSSAGVSQVSAFNSLEQCSKAAAWINGAKQPGMLFLADCLPRDIELPSQ